MTRPIIAGQGKPMSTAPKNALILITYVAAFPVFPKRRCWEVVRWDDSKKWWINPDTQELYARNEIEENIDDSALCPRQCEELGAVWLCELPEDGSPISDIGASEEREFLNLVLDKFEDSVKFLRKTIQPEAA